MYFLKDDSDSNLMDDSGINQPGTSHEFLPEMLHISGILSKLLQIFLP